VVLQWWDEPSHRFHFHPIPHPCRPGRRCRGRRPEARAEERLRAEDHRHDVRQDPPVRSLRLGGGRARRDEQLDDCALETVAPGDRAQAAAGASGDPPSSSRDHRAGGGGGEWPRLAGVGVDPGAALSGRLRAQDQRALRGAEPRRPAEGSRGSRGAGGAAEGAACDAGRGTGGTGGGGPSGGSRSCGGRGAGWRRSGAGQPPSQRHRGEGAHAAGGSSAGLLWRGFP
jgi:hypothetical protein